jgi:Uma2 family endonuclease
MEVAASRVAIDSGSKKQVYHRNGVLQYLIWQSYENQIEWFGLTDGEYQLLLPEPNGIIRSRVFPGVWLAVDALLNNQMPQVLEVLQAGLQSPEHHAFVERLGKGV